MLLKSGMVGLLLLAIGNQSLAGFSPILLQMEPINRVDEPIFTFIVHNLDANRIEPYSFVVNGNGQGFSGIESGSYRILSSKLQIGGQTIPNYCLLQNQVFSNVSLTIQLTNAASGNGAVDCHVTTYPLLGLQ